MSPASTPPAIRITAAAEGRAAVGPAQRRVPPHQEPLRQQPEPRRQQRPPQLRLPGEAGHGRTLFGI